VASPLLRLLPALLLLTGCLRPYQKGDASWYGRQYAGRPTASGDVFRPWKKTAAHKELPLGTVVKVKRVDNGKTVRVLINDRGPYIDGRIIDLSRRSARKIGMVDEGVTEVEIRIVGCRRRYGHCDKLP
jgi:rare lipoprotein A